jgi:D-alanine-D-alanine ligase
LFTNLDDKLIKDLAFPLIVKPNSEGSGIGIKSNSIVKNQKELSLAIATILDKYHQPALVEEFLPGREFTVAIIGNGKEAFTLPIVEVNFEAFPKDVPRVDTFEAKFVYGATGVAEMTKTEFCPAPVTDKLAKEINRAALSAYHTIGCLDFGRVDLRMGTDDKVYVMEINHPPGLMSDENESSFFTIAGRAAGFTFPQMMGKILDAAISRLGI